MNIRLRVLPTVNARVSATNGIAVDKEGADFVVKPAFDQLQVVPAVPDQQTSRFMIYDALNDTYAAIPFDALTNNIQDVIIGPNLAAIDEVTTGTNTGIYYTAEGEAATYTVSDFTRSISSADDEAAFRSGLSLGSAALADTDDFATSVDLNARIPTPVADTFLVANAAGTVRENKTFSQTRDTLEISGRYNGSAPYISQMARFRQFGIKPEDVDSGNEIGNDADAAIPLRQMFGQGHSDDITVFNLAAGQTYTLASFDPTDTSKAFGVLLKNVTKNIFINANGAVIKGTDAIQDPTLDNPASMFRVECAITNPDLRSDVIFSWNGGTIDTKDITSAYVKGDPTVGALSLAGRLNVILDTILFDAGFTTAVGDNVGTGGGDQAVFGSNLESYISNKCIFRGHPDLAEYMSNSGLTFSRHIANLYIGNTNCIGWKRGSSGGFVGFSRFFKNGTCLYNPVADGLLDNHGGRVWAHANYFEKTQGRVLDLGGKIAGESRFSNNDIVDFGRRISDGTPFVNAGGIIAAARVRVPNVMLTDNKIRLGEWEINGTQSGEAAGNEQVGIEFNYSGGTIATGAVNCVSNGNFFSKLQRAHVMEANTSGNDRRDFKTINITLPDLENTARSNTFPIQLPDDTMFNFKPPAGIGYFYIESLVEANGFPNGLCRYAVGSVPVQKDFKNTGNISFTMGTATVLDAVDGNFTISQMPDGSINAINRRGGPTHCRVAFVGY